jgi:heparan-alpha-glucosaminide N-acetyltransferase
MSNEAPSSSIGPPRLAALDVYRGFVMFLMAAELLEVPKVAKAFPQSEVWQFLKQHSTHVAWTGCSLHDLIQPSFSFLVGAALPFSIASRMMKGQSTARMWMHALWRSLLLVLLGVFLRSMGSSMTHWTFEDTLTQIGLGYPFLFLLGFAGNKARWTSLILILVAYWLAFACFRLPPPDFDYAAAHVAKAWSHHFEGFAAHWNINSNAAWAFDVWFLNLFPR